MALLDLTAAAHRAPSIASVSFGKFRAWVSARRAARSETLALHSLLFMPQTRLDDLGISRHDLIQAMEIHRK